MGERWQMAVTAAERAAIMRLRAATATDPEGCTPATVEDSIAVRPLIWRLASAALPVPDVHNADGSFATIAGEAVENDATRIARELQRNIHRLSGAGEAALLGLYFAVRITLAINAALARVQGRPVVTDHRAFDDGSVAEASDGHWRVVRDGEVHAPPHKIGLAHRWCDECAADAEVEVFQP